MQAITIKPKTCSKCNRAFPPTPEYFRRDKACRGGLRGDCKLCTHARERMGVSEARLLKSPCYDFEKLYRELHCETCHKMARHIFCQSRVSTGKTVYACLDCGEENSHAG